MSLVTEDDVPEPDDEVIAACCARFRENLQSVIEMMEFDKEIVDFARSKVQHISDALQQSKRRWLSLETPVANALALLTNIRNNQSLKKQYQNIHNQGVVLLVSYFASALRDVFARCLNERLARIHIDDLPDDSFKLTLADLRQMDITSLAELVIEKKELNFQNMGSVARAFRDWLKYEPGRDAHVNNIITAQACRHAIVHAGVRADTKLIAELKKLSPRTVKEQIAVGDDINFTLDEIRDVSNSMTVYLLRAADGAWRGLPTA